jgi:molecular chaperone GrpE
MSQSEESFGFPVDESSEGENASRSPSTDSIDGEPAGVTDSDAAALADEVGGVDPDIARLDTDDDTADARLEEAAVEVEPSLEELAAKADEYLALAQRTRADFDNYRKRATREAALAQERGLSKLAKELLPAIDNLGRALQAGAAEAAAVAAAGAGEATVLSGHLIDGVKLVQADLLAAFARVGIEPYSPDGEVFDPQLHEAVAQAPVEGAASGTVVEVYQQGYRLGETVLRPARVLVAA